MQSLRSVVQGSQLVYNSLATLLSNKFNLKISVRQESMELV